MNKMKLPKRNPIAKELRTPKYRMRVVVDRRKRDPKYKGNLNWLS